MKNTNEEDIKEINQHISDALKQWSDIMLLADSDEWSYSLEYSDEDVLNALYIFNHVAQNIAIKSGWYKDEEDIFDKITVFREQLKISYGIDSVELAKKVLNKDV